MKPFAVMSMRIAYLFSDGPEAPRGKIICLYVLIVAANAAVWISAFLLFGNQTTLWGALSLRMRSACDMP
jgi:hypothetical protein